MDAIFDELQRTLAEQGPGAAIDRLCAALRDNKEYDKLFYALLLKKRHELGVYPVPTDATQFLPEAVQKPYEDAIRAAGRVGGQRYTGQEDIPRGWKSFDTSAE